MREPTQKRGDFTMDNNNVNGPPQKEHKEILFYFSTTSVTVMLKEKKLSFSSFLSAVGGNLGLFLGFSFFGSLTVFYNVMLKAFAKNNK